MRPISSCLSYLEVVMPQGLGPSPRCCARVSSSRHSLRLVSGSQSWPGSIRRFSAISASTAPPSATPTDGHLPSLMSCQVVGSVHGQMLGRLFMFRAVFFSFLFFSVACVFCFNLEGWKQLEGWINGSSSFAARWFRHLETIIPQLCAPLAVRD